MTPTPHPPARDAERDAMIEAVCRAICRQYNDDEERWPFNMEDALTAVNAIMPILATSSSAASRSTAALEEVARLRAENAGLRKLLVRGLAGAERDIPQNTNIWRKEIIAALSNEQAAVDDGERG